MQSNLRLSRLHSYPTTALGIARLQLEITLNYKPLTFYERAFRLRADNFPLQRLAFSPMQARLKKRPPGDLSAHHKKTKLPEKLWYHAP